MESHDPEDNVDLADLEARLYAQVHHDTGNNINLPSGNGSIASAASGFKENTVRIVNNNNRSLVNNATVNQQLKTRYWLNSSEKRSDLYLGNSSKPDFRGSVHDETPPAVTSETPTIKKFVPYTSLLAGIQELVPEPVASVVNASPVKKGNSTKTAKNKIMNPFNRMNLENLSKQKKIFEKKKAKPEKSTKKPAKLETIVLESTDADDDDDDVIVVPAPELPTVCLDSSDESEHVKDEFTLPKNKTKKTQQKRSSRCPSPSVSSIHSDDFIGQTERSRINEPFGDGQCLPDDELQFDHTTVGALCHNVLEKTDSAVFIRPRDDSKAVDSDSTQTSSQTSSSIDINLQKQKTNINAAESNSSSTTTTECSNSSDLGKNIIAIRKELGRSISDQTKTKRKSSPISTEVQSIKKKRLSKRRKSGSAQSSDSSDSDTSSHGKYVKLTSTPKVTSKNEKSLSKYDVARPRCPRFDSANYSDQDFMSILSNMVNPLKEISSENENDDVIECPPEKNTKDASVILVEDSNKSIVDKKIESKNKQSMPASKSDDTDQSCVIICDSVDEPTSKKLEEPADLEIGWNYEMKHFYNNRWTNADEDDEFENIWYRMPTNKKFWPINNIDKYPMARHTSRVRCRNCNEFGHIGAKCMVARRPIVCYLCGLQGHREPRCPNTICLRCGAKTKATISQCKFCAQEKNMVCALCKCRGHSIQYCADKWRRYHSTTEDNVLLNANIVYNRKKHCSCCGKRGHTTYECSNAAKIFNSFGGATDYIQSHSPSYPRNLEDSSVNNVYQYNLISFFENYKINWDKSILTDDRFLGRALKGMEIPKPPRPAKLRKSEKVKKRKLSKEKPADVDRSVEIIECSDDAVNISAESASITNCNNFSFTNEMKKLNDSKKFQLEFLTKEPEAPSTQRKNIMPGVVNLTITVNATTSERTVESLNKSNVVQPADEDSNFSFSEFYDVNHENTPKPQVSLEINQTNIVNNFGENMSSELLAKANEFSTPVFIPFPEDSSEKEIITAPQIVSDAKVFLTKEHCKILMTQSGTEFLEQTSNKLNLKVMISWESYSNILNVHGIASNQDLFHRTLIEYFDKIESERSRKKLENSIQVPRNKLKVIEYIQMHLKKLEKRYSKGRINYDRVASTEDGKLHLAALKLSLSNLKNDADSVTISPGMRNDIRAHLRFIFAPIAMVAEGVNHRPIVKCVESTAKINTESNSLVPVSQPSTKLFSPEDNGVDNELDSILANDLADSGDNLTMNIIEHEDNENRMQPAEDYISIVSNADDKKYKKKTFWSLKGIQLIETCSYLMKSCNNQNVLSKLETVNAKALAGKLTCYDYRKLTYILKKINTNVMPRNGTMIESGEMPAGETVEETTEEQYIKL